jgi:RNA polymerase sigma-32 factor
MALGSGSRRRPPAAGRSRKAKAQPDEERDEDAAEAEPKEDGDGESEAEAETDADPDDKFLAEAGAVIDVGDEEVSDEDEAFKALEAKKGDDRVGLIKRDPMQAYMQEVRRYPLLTPDEEHVPRLVEHGDSTAAR